MSAATGGNSLNTIGIASAADLFGISGSQTAVWGQGAGLNVTVDAGDILIKYTYGGDATLDGVVKGDDYAQIDSAYPQTVLFGWLNGDFNYDGVINGGDYSIMDSNFPQQGPDL